jgi:hypothetical protein
LLDFLKAYPAVFIQLNMKLLLSRKEITLRLREASRENCLNWRGSPLRSGGYVLFALANDMTVQTGQIIDIRDYCDIPKKEKASLISKPSDGLTRMVLIRHQSYLKEWCSIDSGIYSDVPDGLNEVVDTLELEWIPCNAITSVCFIIHLDTIQRGFICCKGMKKFF